MVALELLKRMSERGPWSAVLQDASEWVSLPISKTLNQLAASQLLIQAYCMQCKLIL